MAVIKRQLENGKTPTKRGIPRKLIKVYSTEFDKWRITQLARAEGVSTSAYINKLIKIELEKNPSLDLGERG